jgi:hypothetical protein
MGRRIDLSGAEIRGGDHGDGGPPIFLPRHTAAASPLLALDIGGTKLAPPAPPFLLNFGRLPSRGSEPGETNSARSQGPW